MYYPAARETLTCPHKESIFHALSPTMRVLPLLPLCSCVCVPYRICAACKLSIIQVSAFFCGIAYVRKACDEP